MELKIGTVEKKISRFTDEINRADGNATEHLRVEIDGTQQPISELDNLITQNFTGDITLVDGGTEENFTGFEYNSIQKLNDNVRKQVTVAFEKRLEE